MVEILQQYRIMFENMVEGAFYQLNDGTLVDVNPAALEMFGLTRDQFMGRTSYHPDWRVVGEDGRELPPEQHPSMLALRSSAAVKGAVVGVFNPLRKSIVWMNVNAIPMFQDGDECPFQVFVTLHDITEKKLAESALRESEYRFRSLFEGMNEGVALHNVVYGENDEIIDYTIVGVNPSYEKILGIEKESVIGRTGAEAYGTAYPPYLKEFTSVLALGEGIYFETFFPPMDKFFSISVIPWEDKGFATIFSDITDRKIREQQLKEFNSELERRVHERTAELQRINSELESFCYAISHEFRAPLARLEGFATMILDIAGAGGEEAIIHCANRIVAASDRLRKVIDSLLAMSRLSRAGINLQNINLSDMAQRIVSELIENIGDRRIYVSIDPDMQVTGDRYMLEICLRNLLGNAIKYSSTTPQASLEFSHKVIDGENVFSISDNGIGFDMKHAKSIFQPFCRLLNESEFDGIGVGLATVHRIIEKHNGRIWVEADPGRGATFCFTLGETEVDYE